MPKEEKLNGLIRAMHEGDKNAREQFHIYLYPILHNFIQKRVKGRIQHETLQTTLILHDLLLMIEKKENLSFKDTGSLYAFTAKLLREYLVDYYRRKNAEKRGGNVEIDYLDDEPISNQNTNADFLVDLNTCLRNLEKESIRARRILDLKVIAGFSNQKIADLMGITVYEVKKEYALACLWLSKRLKPANSARLWPGT